MTTTAEHRHTCDHCHETRPLSDINLHCDVRTDVTAECKDRERCRQRAQELAQQATVDGHDPQCETTFDHQAWEWLPCDCAWRAEQRAEETTA